MAQLKRVRVLAPAVDQMQYPALTRTVRNLLGQKIALRSGYPLWAFIDRFSQQVAFQVQACSIPESLKWLSIARNELLTISSSALITHNVFNGSCVLYNIWLVYGAILQSQSKHQQNRNNRWVIWLQSEKHERSFTYLRGSSVNWYYTCKTNSLTVIILI